jgi:spermidine/putrescine-binding protein
MKNHATLHAVVLAVAFLLVAAVPAKQAYSQDESISVSCYKGNTEEGNYIGEITVNALQNAAQDCNTEYEGCQGACLGCVVDSNANQVCYDTDGNIVSPQ